MTSPATRRTWIVGGTALAVVALAVTTIQVVGLLARDSETVEAVFPAAEVDVLDVEAHNGDVEVVGGDVDEIEVTAEVDHGFRRTTHRADVRDGVLELRSSCPLLSNWCRVEYRVVVPDDIEVRIGSDNGRLIVHDVDGTVTARSDNGSIEARGLGGDLDLASDNGRVDGTGLVSATVVATSSNGRVSLAFDDPPSTVEARTSNGAVEVVVPDAEASYRVDIGTDNGSTDNGVRTDPRSDRSIRARSSNGSVAVRYPTG